MTAGRYWGAGLAAMIMCSAPGAALAADLPVVYPEPTPVYKPAVGGWYLRGSLGMSNQRLGRLHYEYFDEPGFEQTWLDDGGFDAGVTAGVGLGYRFNDWFRTDVTAEYRGKTSFDALDRVVDTTTGAVFTNDYEAKKSEWLVLANAYADLGNFHGLVPYIGAGIGASRNTISHFTDINTPAGGGGFAGSDSEWNFAWALHAGVGYEVNERLTLDFGYSYLDLGDATTAPAQNFDPAFSRPNDGFKFEDITSHDFKVGLRYAFN